MTSLVIGRDQSGAVDFSLPLCDKKYGVKLTPNTAVNMNVPSIYTKAIFSYSVGSNVWVEFTNNKTAELPTTTFSELTAELNPVARYGLIPGNTISVICDLDAYVNILFFKN